MVGLVITPGTSIYGYFPTGAKSWLVVKEGVEDTAREVFCDSDIHITANGHRYLGGVIGSEAFEQQFLQQKVQDWISDIKKLSTIAESQPHDAYSVYCHGLSFRYFKVKRPFISLNMVLVSLINYVMISPY